jgi:hypothetical protein
VAETAKYKSVTIFVVLCVQDALAKQKMPEWQIVGFYDWLRLYFLTGKLVTVKSDLPSLGVQPTSFGDWLRSRKGLFEQERKFVGSEPLALR